MKVHTLLGCMECSV